MVTPGLGILPEPSARSAPPADDSQALTRSAAASSCGRSGVAGGRASTAARRYGKTRGAKKSVVAAFCMYPETSLAVIR
jgi:hypothetical protein